ncbi:YolD-like family protein [Lentibacillus sp. CBA3610]|uniref:YolD-like family protein n=1 Tax=Lentibacillus sp. CBA3610 TaxID=2518176 RepID=UPI001595C4F4|nr:YolD-like family protein [Lentibacillus sp. CBA3610]QKY69160.1 YolD-like family protein [Lentibacillus sp. CBA3610]
MPRDRGSIKWSSLMLPEHAELLKEMWENDGERIKPNLDEQQSELLNAQLLEAFEFQVPVCLQIYENGTIAEVTGVLNKLDSQTGHVILNRFSEPDKRIAFHNILSIGCLYDQSG